MEGDPRRASGADWRFAALSGSALALALYGSFLRPGACFFERDLPIYWYPQAQALARALGQAVLPTWDACAGFGGPLLANPSAQALYPLTWLLALLSPSAQYTASVLFHAVFTVTGQALLARRLGASRPAALLAGLLWGASGPVVSLANLWTHAAGAAWLPWVALAALGVRREAGLRSALALGASLALQLFAGSPEMLMAGFAAALAVAGPGPGAPGRGLLRALALAGLVALGLGAAQWLPTLELLPGTGRLALPGQLRTAWSTPPLRLAEFLLAVPLSRLPLPPSLAAQVADVFLTSLYLGLAALPLAVAGLLGRTRSHLALALLGVLAALLALGPSGPVYLVAQAILPALRVVRYPEKFMPLVAFAWSLLAGLGLDRLARSRWQRAVAVLVPVLALPAAVGQPLTVAGLACGAGLLLAWAARPRALPRAVLAVGALAIADVTAAARSVNPVGPCELLEGRPPLLDSLERLAARRVLVYSYADIPGSANRHLGRSRAFRYEGVPASWPEAQIDAVLYRSYLVPPTAGAFGLRGSYDPDVLGLLRPAQRQLVELLRSSEGTPLELRLLRLGAVDHVIALHAVAGLRPAGEVPALLPERIRIFEVPGALPRVRVVGGVRGVPDAPAAVEALTDPAFDPEREVLLTGMPSRPEPAGFQGRADVVADLETRIEVEVELSDPGVVVLADAFDPGWRVRIDGRDAVSREANLGFRGVLVPAGSHRVEWRHAPRSVAIGLGVSLLSVAGCLLALARTARGADPWAV
jgi:hypothetical protein